MSRSRRVCVPLVSRAVVPLHSRGTLETPLAPSPPSYSAAAARPLPGQFERLPSPIWLRERACCKLVGPANPSQPFGDFNCFSNTFQSARRYRWWCRSHNRTNGNFLS